jgi:hypothetical protein
MAPVSFDKHCIACHTLPFDPQVAGSVPHSNPEQVQSFVVASLKQYLEKNPSAWKASPSTMRRVPGKQPVSLTAAHSPDEWLRQRIADDEALLWRKTCKQCHQYAPAPAVADVALPQVLPAAFTTRWFRHAVFDHSAHAAVRCDSCHYRASTSQLTSDVLIPGIETCRTCHNGKSSGSAESGCFECHQYHDWKQRKPFKPVYSIPQITGQD